MSFPVNTIEHDRTIFDAALYFHTNSRRRLPVLNNGRLAGQISRRDVVVAALNSEVSVGVSLFSSPNQNIPTVF